MAKIPLLPWSAQPSSRMYSLHSFHLLSASLLLSVAVLGAWLPAASARPIIQVRGGYVSPAQTITFPPVLPFSGLIHSPIQPIVRSGFGLSVQIGSPTYYPSGVYPSGVYPSSYTNSQRSFQQQGTVNNSVLINPTVINGSIRNSTLVNPTIVTTPYAAPYYPATSYPAPYYPTPYYDVRTVVTTTRPEPQVVIDPQYGVRYQAPSFSPERQVVVDPHYGVRYSNPSGY